MNCGDGRRCYNGGVCRLQVDKEGQPSTTCDCPTGFGGETCQAGQQQNVIPPIKLPPRDHIGDNKTALVWGILFISIFSAYCSWYTIRKFTIQKDISYVEVELQHGLDYDNKSEASTESYEEVELQHGAEYDEQSEGSAESYEDVPRWRNVV